MKDLDAKKQVLSQIISMLDDSDKTTLKSRKKPKQEALEDTKEDC